MMHRCYHEHRKDYKYYGGRGIKVCDRWHNFDYFVEDMRPSYKKGLSLDRRDNDGGYSKENCSWVPHKQQCRNRSSTHFITNPNSGDRYTITELSKIYNVPRTTIHSRIMLGHKDFERLVKKPRKIKSFKRWREK